MLSQAQSGILENWGYGQPRIDELEKAAKKSRRGWLIFGLGVSLQLVALVF